GRSVHESSDRSTHLTQGTVMAQQGKQSNDGVSPASLGSPAAHRADQNQIDFELDFFSGILERTPDYVDVLRVMGHLLTLKGRYQEGLQVDKRLVTLRSHDALAHYNLACSYALLKRGEPAL